MSTVTLTLELLDNEAMALAQVLKRMGYGDMERLSSSATETGLALLAMAKLHAALADNGYNPR